MRIIAIEEHFTTPMYREHAHESEFRGYFMKAISARVGHDVREQLFDIDAERLRYMDAAGIDVQVLSFTSPGPQGYGREIAIPMARDANDRLRHAIDRHPDRFAGFAALPTADPDEAVRE